ncbi:FAD-dependent oxidoreductase [Sulfurimonas sp.]|uniref:FAD-dependent oxidoreductase n=1 Tax=Sulfurimonas sp. TaxID=2022749 RepID=UPI00356170B2
MKDTKIAIIGGGVAGSTTALYLGNLGLDVTLFEKQNDLISGPPFCHLHAGGNLYREISDEQCVTLLKQSIDFLRYYPYVVDYRPTVIVLPKEDKGTPQKLIPRLELLTKEYQKLIDLDEKNMVLGKSEEYFKVYTEEDMQLLKNKESSSIPKSMDEWMIPVAKNIDFTKVQFPIIMVQEYGLNLFRLASGVKTSLSKIANITLRTNTKVKNIIREKDSDSFVFTYEKDNQEHSENFDYIINAAGFRSGKIDDMLGVPCKRMVEFKAAYVTKWENNDTLFPEIIFHGERGTPQGMGQFTPYPNGHFQLHGMTEEITLYKGGLVANTKQSCQPQLQEDFIKKIESSWDQEEIDSRTKKAIEHISKYIPSFSNATVASKPLFGAQQIPGDDPTLRVAEVSFVDKNYARCEVVKVSSVLSMIDAIVKEFIKLGFLDDSVINSRDTKHLEELQEEEIVQNAKIIAQDKGYPAAMSNTNIKNKV